VAYVLDPRIKTTFIAAQMSEPDAEIIIGQVRSFLGKEYPFEATILTQLERPLRMSESPAPPPAILTANVDKYMDSPPVNWPHQLIKDGDPEWVLEWWKANTFEYPSMAQAVRDYLPAEVGIERVFSGARYMLGLRRQSMSGETMRWLMLLIKEWKRK
jgi:hAT family C-terminal dimerisation region